GQTVLARTGWPNQSPRRSDASQTMPGPARRGSRLHLSQTQDRLRSSGRRWREEARRARLIAAPPPHRENPWRDLRLLLAAGAVFRSRASAAQALNPTIAILPEANSRGSHAPPRLARIP